MRKILFYLPAILFALFYGLVMLTGLPIAFGAWICILLFSVSGILLGKNKFWGGIFGVVPGVYFIYMSTIDTGQIINIELPTGIVVVIYFLACCGYILHENRRTSKSFSHHQTYGNPQATLSEPNHDGESGRL